MEYVARPKIIYRKIVPAMMEEFGYKSIMQVPKLEKKNCCVSRFRCCNCRQKIVDYAVEELTAITGQKAVGTLSKKDEAAFKLRKRYASWCKSNIRAEKMYEFLDRLTSSALPRIRDFNGIKADGFDGRGNYNLGITEQIIFPEIVIDKVKKNPRDGHHFRYYY